MKIFPWFVLGFAAACVIGTFAPMPAGSGKLLSQIGKFVIVMAMTAIGLNTDLKKLVKRAENRFFSAFAAGPSFP